MSMDAALLPPPVQRHPGGTYLSEHRRWQGIPTIERTPRGRLWAAWYSGGKGEGPENYVLLVTSDDDGATWSPPVLAIDPPDKVRAYDECLWLDPNGLLWLFWAQSYEWFDGRCGVWAIQTGEPESFSPQWTPPRRLCNGIMLNKPTVLSTGEWLLPTAVWASQEPRRLDLAGERYSNVVASTDGGSTFHLRGRADVPDRSFDEHMIIEREDGSLWMLVRTSYGIGEAVSNDGGRTWSAGRDSGIPGPNARFFIRRLRSGRLLLVNHYRFTGRSHLTARLSEDDGATWNDGLLLDERPDVSYPDGVEADDGRITIIYDRDRQGDGDILMAVFREEDVLEGQPVTADVRLKQVVSTLKHRA